jgi:protein-disulfide isomerase
MIPMMPRRPFVAALSFALALAGCSKKADEGSSQPSGPVAAVAPPAGKSWTEVAAMTPEGGVRIGNPDAPVKFVEYASLTCPHCRDFTAEAAEPLQQKYISTGKVSWEYRPFILNSLDVAAFLLARCRGAEPFFKLAEQAYAQQNDWVGKFMALTPEQQAQMQASDPSQLFKKIAAASGLDSFFRVRGLPAAQADKCLADQAAAQALADNTNKANTEQNVTGTPTFFFNGTKADDLHTWSDVDKRLGALTGS